MFGIGEDIAILMQMQVSTLKKINASKLIKSCGGNKVLY